MTTQEKAKNIFHQIFTNSAQWIAKLAPNGWQKSPYYQLNHPSPEQRYETALALQKMMASILKDKEQEPITLAQFQEEAAAPCFPEDEFRKLLGDCLWLIFSNNHSVLSSKGEELDIGSFRGSATFIADFLNENYPPSNTSYDYMNFYCVDNEAFEEVDIRSVFELIFQVLKANDYDWRYAFPKINVVDFSNSSSEKQDDPATYNPTESMERALAKQAKKEEVNQLKNKLKDLYEQEREDALYRPPPPEVAAYREVYGRLPVGYPQL